jgi:hypothetical protein
MRTGYGRRPSARPVAGPVTKLKKAQTDRAVPVPGNRLTVTYCIRAPHPPSERRTDAGQLPPWLLGVALCVDL